ncbi:MAG: hypothetical protein OXD46_05175 [Chloroflexi bacterium]|nr:hypothetical protein [Chloroflexota bacterium]
MEISTDLLKVIILLPPALVVGLAAYRLYLEYRKWEAKRWAENMVRMSDRILLSDITALAKANSPLFADAIALYCAQLEQGRNPDD